MKRVRRILPAVWGLIGLAIFFVFAYPMLAPTRAGSVKMGPKHRELLKQLEGARAARKDGRLAEAEATFRDVRKTLKDDVTAYDFTRLLRDAGKLQEAKDLFQYIVHPNERHGSTLATNSIVLKEYAELCKKVGDSKEAKWALDKANELVGANKKRREALEKPSRP